MHLDMLVLMYAPSILREVTRRSSAETSRTLETLGTLQLFSTTVPELSPQLFQNFLPAVASVR